MDMISVSTSRSRDVLTSRLGLISVTETCVSGLVSVSAKKVSCTSLLYTASEFVSFKLRLL